MVGPCSFSLDGRSWRWQALLPEFWRMTSNCDLHISPDTLCIVCLDSSRRRESLRQLELTPKAPHCTGDSSIRCHRISLIVLRGPPNFFMAIVPGRIRTRRRRKPSRSLQSLLRQHLELRFILPSYVRTEGSGQHLFLVRCTMEHHSNSL